MISLRPILYGLLVYLTIPALAQQPRVSGAQSIHPVPSAVKTQQERIQRLLPEPTKRKLGTLVPAFREEVMKLPPQANLEKAAASDVHKTFPGISTQQSEVLVFALLEQTADSMSDLSETAQLLLQMTMDRRSKLLETASNVLKQAQDTADSIVQNLK